MFGYEPKGQGFESLPARQNSRYPSGYLLFLCFGRDFEPEGFGEATETRSGAVARVSRKANYFGHRISGQNNADAEYPRWITKISDTHQMGIGYFFDM